MVFIKSKNSLRVISIANAFGYAFMILFNILGSTRGWNGGETNQSVSARYTTFITPAGWAFSIWGLIFFGLGLFTIYQLLPSNLHSIVRRIQFFFFFNLILNGVWGVAFDYEVMWLALFIIVLMWISLFICYMRLHRWILNKKWRKGGEYEAEDEDEEEEYQEELKHRASSWKAAARWLFLVEFPISIYLSWLTIATLLNWNIQCLVWDALDTVGWSISYLIIAEVITLLMLYFRLDFFFSFIASWALFAVADGQKQQVEPSTAIETLSYVLAGVNIFGGLVAAGLRFVRWQRGERRAEEGEGGILKW